MAARYTVTFADFEQALTRVQPSAKREGFAIIPDVSWDDVGALGGPREFDTLCNWKNKEKKRKRGEEQQGGKKEGGGGEGNC